MATVAGGAEATIARRRARGVSVATMLALTGGATVVVGTWLPWMSYFAGLVPLRGLIGLNGRLLLVAGTLAVVLGGTATWSGEPRMLRIARRASGLIGLGVAAAAVWLLIGVHQLTRVHMSNAMLVPRAGIGLFVVLIGGCILAAAAVVRPPRITDPKAE
jgi:hypothetical protein